jgi:hypothetical protein
VSLKLRFGGLGRETCRADAGGDGAGDGGLTRADVAIGGMTGVTCVGDFVMETWPASDLMDIGTLRWAVANEPINGCGDMFCVTHEKNENGIEDWKNQP